MISILTLCYSRQEMLNATLPLWQRQKGVDFEIIVGAGPGISVPNAPRIKYVHIPKFKLNNAYNKLLSVARGEQVLITQSDVQVNDTLQLKRMLDKWNPRNMVSERIWKEGKRDAGVYLYCLLVDRSAVIDVGGWYEGFDCPATAAHEDADLVARLLEQGQNMSLIETPLEHGVFHIDHPKPDYHSDPIMLDRLHNGHAVYKSRHSESLMQLYVKQFCRNMMEKRLV
jgi:GT2 family glycosyltransferase